MLTCVFCVIAAAGALAALCCLAAAGFRNGDRPGDTLVTAVPATASLIVRNPSGAPVLVGMRASSALLPAWLAAPHDVTVPRRTLRRKFAPERQAAVGVVPAGGAAEYAAPGRARGSRTVLTVAVGQEGRRLRVHRLRPGPASHAAAGRGGLSSPVPLP